MVGSTGGAFRVLAAFVSQSNALLRSPQLFSHIISRNYHATSCMLKRRKTQEERKSERIIEYSPKPKREVIEVWRDITIAELAKVLNRDANFVKDLFLGKIQNNHSVIDDVKLLKEGIQRSGKRMLLIGRPNSDPALKEEKDLLPRLPAPKSMLQPRPPIVTVMGHVDHGKTTLLDALRQSKIVDQEFGGITQHIGAFSVTMDSGAKITFLDTPGHAAFSSMRARGANLTDIVVLVVAADDGVMEQTVQSIKMARQANVPILVAINKIDAPHADVERTEHSLMQVGIQVEKFGGDVQAVPISALKRLNLKQLTEALILQAELLDLGGDPTGLVEGVVVESRVDPHRGCLSTVIVQRGTLRPQNILVADIAMAKVRALRDEYGNLLQQVPPGYPVEVEGWRSLPTAGEFVLQAKTEKQARIAITVRNEKKSQAKQEEDLVAIEAKEEQHLRVYKEKVQQKRRLGRFKTAKEGPRKPEIQSDTNTPALNIVIKSDVNGTLEAILDTLDTYDSTECKLDLVHYGVGAITENDVELAHAFKGVIYAFNVDCPVPVQEHADLKEISVKFYNVIYKLVDDVMEEINRKLPLKETEDITGEATILQQFEINERRRKVSVAGCRCTKGVLKRTSKYRIFRNEEIIYEGALVSMRHLKNEVDSIKIDTECGLQFDDKGVAFQSGDKVVCYEIKMEPQKIDWDPGF